MYSNLSAGLVLRRAAPSRSSVLRGNRVRQPFPPIDSSPRSLDNPATTVRNEPRHLTLRLDRLMTPSVLSILAPLDPYWDRIIRRPLSSGEVDDLQRQVGLAVPGPLKDYL